MLKQLLKVYSGNPTLWINYWPNSIKISVIKMIPKRMTKTYQFYLRFLYVCYCKTLPIYQISFLTKFGFRKHHSHTLPNHRIVNYINKAFEGKQYCSAVFLDIKQTFDEAWHKDLLDKIRLLLRKNAGIISQ